MIPLREQFGKGCAGMYNIGDFYEAVNQIAAFSAAESWDNPGLLIGSKKMRVRGALLALDVTDAVLAEARLLDANLIITHHPVIFPSIKNIDAESLIYRLIVERISVISAHTNLDTAAGGVNDALAETLGLQNIRPLESAENPGFGRIGELPQALSPDVFAAFVKERLHAGGVRYTAGREISAAAVCGGSGAALWRDALQQGAQALVTSEVKHHMLLESHRAGFTLIDAGHYATEAVAIEPFARQLSRLLPNAALTVSKAGADPARYL